MTISIDTTHLGRTLPQLKDDLAGAEAIRDAAAIKYGDSGAWSDFQALDVARGGVAAARHELTNGHKQFQALRRRLDEAEAARAKADREWGDAPGSRAHEQAYIAAALAFSDAAQALVAYTSEVPDETF